MSRRLVVILCLVSFAAGYYVKSLLGRYNIRLIVIEKKSYATKVEDPPMPLTVVETVPDLPVETKSRRPPDDTPARAEVRAIKPVERKPVDRPKGFAFPIDATDLGLMKKNVGRNVTVVGEIKDVFHSERSDTYFVKFSDSRNGFTVVIFKSTARQFAARQIDIESLKGKRIKVGGIMKDHPKYGLQFILNSPDEIKVIK